MTTARSALIEILRRKKWTVGFAESCTGGRLSSLFTEIAGVSDVFLGGVVSYSNQVKTDLLDVRPETLQGFGAVSENTAREMARGAKARLKVDTAVSITGIAGPDGGTPAKPVGTVCFTAIGPNFEVATTKHFQGDRVSIQVQATEFAMELLRSEAEKP